ncbi:MAG: hypothetical protein ACI8YQ_005316 [Polaribacter sp.]
MTVYFSAIFSKKIIPDRRVCNDFFEKTSKKIPSSKFYI